MTIVFINDEEVNIMIRTDRKTDRRTTTHVEVASRRKILEPVFD